MRCVLYHSSMEVGSPLVLPMAAGQDQTQWDRTSHAVRATSRKDGSRMLNFCLDSLRPTLPWQ